MSTHTHTLNVYTIYKITNVNSNSVVYIGMTLQPLAKRLSQHISDAKSNSCSITSKLCQKKPPADLQRLHKLLKMNPKIYKISKIKNITGTYIQAHNEEIKLK